MADDGLTEDERRHLGSMADLAKEAELHPEQVAYARAVGAEVLRLRQEHGWSRADLARRSGVGDRCIQLLEYGLLPQGQVEDDDVEALAEALNVQPAYLWRTGAAAAGSEEPSTGERIAAAVAGLLEAVGGIWHATVLPTPAAAWRGPAEPTSAEAGPRMAVDRDATGTTSLCVDAGGEAAGCTVRLMRLREDGQSQEEVTRTVLDEHGRAQLPLPEAGRPLSVEIGDPLA